ncbi:hypothetical protein Tco_0753582 [Tanacetum coccineum]
MACRGRKHFPLEVFKEIMASTILQFSKPPACCIVNSLPSGAVDMIVKDLDLEPKDIIAKFCGPSRWKKLSKESGSKILPCGDGSCWKAFKPIASLIAFDVVALPLPKSTVVVGLITMAVPTHYGEETSCACKEGKSCILSGAVSLGNPFSLAIAYSDIHKGSKRVYIHCQKTSEFTFYFEMINYLVVFSLPRKLNPRVHTAKAVRDSAVKEVTQLQQELVDFRRISLTGFRSCASRSQTGASQSRQSTE